MPFPRAESESGWEALLGNDAAPAGGVAAICARQGRDAAHVRRYASGSLPVYAVGSNHVLELFPPHDEAFASMQCRLMAWALLHRYSNMRWYLERLPPRGQTTLEQLAARWWSFVDNQ